MRPGVPVFPGIAVPTAVAPGVPDFKVPQFGDTTFGQPATGVPVLKQYAQPVDPKTVAAVRVPEVSLSVVPQGSQIYTPPVTLPKTVFDENEEVFVDEFEEETPSMLLPLAAAGVAAYFLFA